MQYALLIYSRPGAALSLAGLLAAAVMVRAARGRRPAAAP